MRISNVCFTTFSFVNCFLLATAAPWNEWVVRIPYIKAVTTRSLKIDDLLIGLIVLASGSGVPLTGINTPVIRNTTFPFTRIGSIRRGETLHVDPFSGQVLQTYPGDQLQVSVIIVNQGANPRGNDLANLIGGMANAVSTIVGGAVDSPLFLPTTDQVTTAIGGFLRGGCDGVVLARTFHVTLHDFAIMGPNQNIQRPLSHRGGDHNTGSMFCNPTNQHYECGVILQLVATADPEISASPTPTTTPRSSPDSIMSWRTSIPTVSPVAALTRASTTTITSRPATSSSVSTEQETLAIISPHPTTTHSSIVVSSWRPAIFTELAILSSSILSSSSFTPVSATNSAIPASSGLITASLLSSATSAPSFSAITTSPISSSPMVRFSSASPTTNCHVITYMTPTASNLVAKYRHKFSTYIYAAPSFISWSGLALVASP